MGAMQALARSWREEASEEMLAIFVQAVKAVRPEIERCLITEPDVARHILIDALLTVAPYAYDELELRLGEALSQVSLVADNANA